MDHCLVPDSAMTHRREGDSGHWDEDCLALAAARDPLGLISSAGPLSSARKDCVEKFSLIKLWLSSSPHPPGLNSVLRLGHNAYPKADKAECLYTHATKFPCSCRSSRIALLCLISLICGMVRKATSLAVLFGVGQY
jgi:hypothetical protein